MARRIVPCTVRPLSPSEARAWARRRAAVIDGGRPRPELRPAVGRRGFLRGTGALAASGAVVGAGGMGTGCGDPITTLTVALTAVTVAKLVFSLVEEIQGSYVMENPGDQEARTEIISDLMTGAELDDVVETFSCIVTLAAGSGPTEVVWCAGVLAQNVGTHIVAAQEGGNEPVKSDPFEVESA